MTEEQFHHQILNRLNVLIALQLDRDRPDAQTSVSGKVERLLAYGLAPKDVASILNKTPNYITAVTSTKKSRATKKAGARNAD